MRAIPSATLTQAFAVLPADQTCLQTAKQQIQHRYALGENGRMRQRDFMYLIDKIEQTAQIRISLSTLKRIWQAELKHLPQPATLDALVSLLDYADWGSFKQALAAAESVPAATKPALSQKPGVYSQFTWPVRPIIAICILLGVAAAIWMNWEPPAVKVHGPITFKVDQTVRTGVPNTFIFTYDLQAVEADSFFIQQSWDPRQKTPVAYDGIHHSTVYMRPGSHMARLIANDSVLSTCLVNVKTDGWLSYTDGKEITYLPTGSNELPLSLSVDSLQAWDVNLDEAGIFSRNIRDFPGSSMRRFSLDARVRALPMDNLHCPFIGLMLHGETGIILIPIGELGCVGNLRIRTGPKVLFGTNHDLSGLGVEDMDEWQDLTMEASADSLHFFVGGELRYALPLEVDLGEIKGVGLRTNTPCEVEEVKLNGEEVD